MAEGYLKYIGGRSRMGKTSLVRNEIKPHPRVLIYDPKGAAGDYTRCHTIDNKDIRVLTRVLRKAGTGPGRYRFIDSQLKNFDLFCWAAFEWVREYGPATVVVDELAAVTNPGKAPANWHRLVSQGMGFGARIYAMTQRPAEADKTTPGNAFEIITFHMKRLDDRRYMASEMDIDVDRVTALKQYEYISDQQKEIIQKTKK